MSAFELDPEIVARLGSRIRELRRARHLTQGQLAELCGISPSYIGLLETGRREIPGDTLTKICRALELTPEELFGQGTALRSASTPIQQVQKILDAARDDLHASSITFYVRDPFWPDELRMVAMTGIQMPEPMYGFVSPEGTRQVLLHGDCEYCSNTLETNERRDVPLRLPNTIPSHRRMLFSDFVDRETVRASARLFIERKEQSDGVGGVLFVNFSQPNEFASPLRHKLAALCETLANIIDEVNRAVHVEDAPALQQAIRLLRPMQDWATRIGRDEQTLEQYLGSVLDDVMAVLGMDPHEGFGTIHLYRPASEELVLAAYRGRFDQGGLAGVQSVVRGEGIISWVALRQRAIVIPDLAVSDFAAIHLPVRSAIRSAIAVPMMAGPVLAGVLNIESAKPGRFTRHHVRALWYAAGTAGVAAGLYRHRRLADLNAKLLEWFCRTEATPKAQEEAIDALANIARLSLEAKQCDIWRFSSDRQDSFYPAGASYPLTADIPRKNGWSEYVCRTQCAVWVSNIQSRNSADILYWNRQQRCWERLPPRSGFPEAANQRVLDLNVGCELGIPIIFEDDCVGVAWLKFSELDRSRPDQEEMLLAARFSEGAGRVLSSLPIASIRPNLQ